MKLCTLALILPACLPAAACASTQHALETAEAKLGEAKAIVAEAEAKRAQVCESALSTLRKVEAVAPFACSLVEVAPGAPKEATAACAARGDLPAAVRNVELACQLGK
jgi:hypothetical protein